MLCSVQRKLTRCGWRTWWALIFVIGLAGIAATLCLLPGPMLFWRKAYAAPEPPATWTTFTQSNSGLPGNAVAALTATPDGGMWIGTYGRGAGYVDANGWVTFAPELDVPDAWVTALARGPGGEVWVGTWGGGLSRYDGESWVIFNTRNSGLPNDWVSALVVTPNGTLWAGTYGGGVVAYDGRRWRTLNRRTAGLAGDRVTAVAAGPNGDIWVGTQGNGVSHFEPVFVGRDAPDSVPGVPIGIWRTHTAGDGLPSNVINAVAVAPSGVVWIATAAGLGRFTPARPAPSTSTGLRGRGEGTWRTFTTQDGLPDNNMRTVAVDDQGAVWVGTSRGVAWLDAGVAPANPSAASSEAAAQRWQVYTRADGLAHDSVEAIAVDAAGNIWLGTLGGISVLGEPEVPEPAERRLPVVLVDGKVVPTRGGLQDSQFRFLARWLRRDGFPTFIATGIDPSRTLYENANRLRAVINDVKAETGANQVFLVGYSMAGLSIRAYTESTLYQGDVAGVFTLGTPHSGVHLWSDLLIGEMVAGDDQPFTRELLPEHMALFNRANANDHGVPYYLVAGQISRQDKLRDLDFLPPSDGLISVWSAYALDRLAASSVGAVADPASELNATLQLATDDMHVWNQDTILSGLPAYFWPQRLYLSYLRPALIRGAGASQPARVQPAVATRPVPQSRTAYRFGELDPATKRELSIPVDPATSARFVLLWRWGDLNVTLKDPLDREIQSDDEGVRRLDLRAPTFANLTVISVEQPMAGTWSVTLDGANLEDRARYAAYAIIDGTVTLEASVTTGWIRPGGTLPITATLKGGTRPIARAGVQAEITWPDGSSEVVLMLDDGEHEDGKPADGVYGRVLTLPRQAGYAPIVITARDTWQGTEFERGRTILVTIMSDAARLTGAVELSFEDVEGLPAGQPHVDVGVDVARAGRFGFSVSLADGAGKEIVRSTWPVSLEAGRHAVHVPVDSALLDGQLIPFSVNQIILMDLNGAAILADEWLGGTQG